MELDKNSIYTDNIKKMDVFILEQDTNEALVCNMLNSDDQYIIPIKDLIFLGNCANCIYNLGEGKISFCQHNSITKCTGGKMLCNGECWKKK